MVARPSRPLPTSDTAALKRIGQSVRARLEADPSAYRIPIDGLEIFAVSDFFSEAECRRLMAIVDEVARPSPTYDDSADLGRTSYSGDVDPWDDSRATVCRGSGIQASFRPLQPLPFILDDRTGSRGAAQLDRNGLSERRGTRWGNRISQDRPVDPAAGWRFAGMEQHDPGWSSQS
jgi:hypothetical protein